MVQSEVLPVCPFCSLSACRSSFFTSRRPMTFCAIAAFLSSKRTFWVHPARKIDRLCFAAFVPAQIRGGALYDHFLLQLLKSEPGLALAIVGELDRGIPRHWPADDSHGIFPDGLVHIIFAIVLTADRPFETNCRHRAGTDPLIAIGGVPFRGECSVLSSYRLFRLTMGFGVIEDAGDRCQRTIGRVA